MGDKKRGRLFLGGFLHTLGIVVFTRVYVCFMKYVSFGFLIQSRLPFANSKILLSMVLIKGL